MSCYEHKWISADPCPACAKAGPLEERQNLLIWAAGESGLQRHRVKLLWAEGFRWMVDFEQDPECADFAKGLIKVERLLQKETGRPIDLRLEVKKDKNKRFDRNYLRGVEKL